MSLCDLYLENYQDHYVGGQTIVGYVLCNFKTSKEVQGIFVKVKGEASTHWTEHESHYDSVQKKNVSRTVHYSGSELIMSHQIDLLKNHGQTITISQGMHKYPFTYNLPSELPTSYKNTLGKIEYKIKAVVERSFFELNYDAETPFNVITPLDLNRDPSLREPATRTKDKITYMLCWFRGNIKVEARVPYTGVAIGQPLPLHIRVENFAQCNVENIKCKVKKLTKFKVTSPHHKTRHDTDTIYTTNYSGVGAHGENTYDKTIVLNDASVCSNFLNCDLIKATYNLKITFELSGCHTNIDIEIPIMVGNVPIGGVHLPPTQMQLAYSGSSAPPSYGFVQPQPAYNPDVLPPPYGIAGMGDFSKTPASYTAYPPSGMPTMPTVPAMATASAPLQAASRDDWVDLSDEVQTLPSYDQATKVPLL